MVLEDKINTGVDSNFTTDSIKYGLSSLLFPFIIPTKFRHRKERKVQERLGIKSIVDKDVRLPGIVSAYSSFLFTLNNLSPYITEEQFNVGFNIFLSSLLVSNIISLGNEYFRRVSYNKISKKESNYKPTISPL